MNLSSQDMNNFDGETWVKTKGIVWIVRVLNSTLETALHFLWLVTYLLLRMISQFLATLVSSSNLICLWAWSMASLSCAYSLTWGLSSKEALNAPD